MNRRSFLKQATAAAILPAFPAPLLALAPGMIRVSDIVQVDVKYCTPFPWKPWTVADLYHFLERVVDVYRIDVMSSGLGFCVAVERENILLVEEYVHWNCPAGMFCEVRDIATGEVSQGLQRLALEEFA